MIKDFARRRMDQIDGEIRKLVDVQDALTRAEEERLNRLDRAHRFWRNMAA
ncbi:hypothetical protein [Hoeflea sp. TYP-13]|uniref:hypothetical protein n=1 Tax=Hoeflea sp. TYP-13 TaxID=3230023 RepID=UPI0034C5F404